MKVFNRFFFKFLMVALLLKATIPSAQAKGVLFIGDSHVPGPFGTTLDALLRTDPNLSVETYGVCAAIAGSFLAPYQTPCGFFFHVENQKPVSGVKGPAPVIQNVLTRMKPELTLIELGSNYTSDADANIVADMARLVKAIKDAGSQCVWISMPDTRMFRAQQPRILNLTRSAIGNDCGFIDSTLLTHYPDQGGDGLHYQSSPQLKPIGVAWGQQVYQQIQSLLPTP